MPDPVPPLTSTRALLRERDYVLFWSSRWLGPSGSQIQGVTMGWQIYAVSRRTLSVGASALNVSLIGLVTFVPLLLLALPAGETADRHDRRRVLMICYAGELLSAIAILVWAAFAGHASVPLLLSRRPSCSARIARLSSHPPTARSAPCWCRVTCCRAPSPSTPWPGSRRRSRDRPWRGC